MKLFATFFFLVIAPFGHSAIPENIYCPPMPQVEKEGDRWNIPESAFTREAATRALKELSSQIDGDVESRDFMVDNDLRMIKGYLFRVYLEEYERSFGKEDTTLRTMFCDFIEDDAFVSH